MPALGLFLFGIVLTEMEKRKIGKIAIKKMGLVLCLIAIVFAAFAGYSFSKQRRDASIALKTGQYEIVEGPVRDFHPMPLGGHPPESFKIEKETFSYSHYIFTACFNHSASHGGPIHEGMVLRVYYVDDCILRVESVSSIAPLLKE